MANESNFSRSTMLVTVALALVLSLVIWPLAQPGKDSVSAETEAEIELNTLPVARLEVQAAPAVAKSDGAPRSGEAVYNSVCKLCHESGLAGAPKTGDRAEWAPRLATGEAALLTAATQGKNAMPARGGAADLTDDELKAAVDYLIEKAK